VREYGDLRGYKNLVRFQPKNCFFILFYASSKPEIFSVSFWLCSCSHVRVARGCSIFISCSLASAEVAAPVFGSLVCILFCSFPLIFFSRVEDLICSFVFGVKILVPVSYSVSGLWLCSAYLLLVFPLC
jgi:hypothetical protein